MSGICGIVTFGDGTPDSSEMETVLESLKCRGPDGANVWTGNRAALGHALLATTPESLLEKLPLHHEESGCTITADVRLDNREDLLNQLAVPSAHRIVGDGELILLAYLKWGQDCPRHLLGDFAFAIWDARQVRLFCARDQRGMRQLAYAHEPGCAFVFATEPSAVLRHPCVPQEPNIGRIADFLDELEHFSLSETFYAAVTRLPPAHCLTLDADGIRLHKYWDLQIPPPLKLKSDEEYAQAFLDVFTNAVRCRLRSPQPVGAMLSGGMDSGSVVAIAAEILAQEGRGPLQTFSVLGPDPSACLETRAIRSALKIKGIEPRLINLENIGAYRNDLVELTKTQSDPFDWQMGLLRAVYLAAHRTGLKVVLDGVAGDLVLDSGSYLARLLRAGKIGRAVREALGEARFWGPDWPAWKSFALAAGRAWVPRPIRVARRRALWRLHDRRIGRTGLISRQFAARAGLRQRRQQLRTRDSWFDRLDARERARHVEHERLIVARERYDRVASAVAIEPRDPFMDLRVTEFCLSLPWEQLQAAGWPKILLRRAMAGKLPDAVRWRRGKEHLGGQFTETLFEPFDVLEFSARRFRETIAPYIHFSDSDAQLEEGEGIEDCSDRMEAIWLFYWLNRPAPPGSSLDPISEGSC